MVGWTWAFGFQGGLSLKFKIKDPFNYDNCQNQWPMETQ